MLTASGPVSKSHLPASTVRTSKCVENSTVTVYGGPDNDPSWNDATAYNCDPARGFHAGGTGSYDDPLSFATAAGEYEECEIIYSPYLKKYLRKDDQRAGCSIPHIDVWTGSSLKTNTATSRSSVKKLSHPTRGRVSSATRPRISMSSVGVYLSRNATHQYVHLRPKEKIADTLNSQASLGWFQVPCREGAKGPRCSKERS